MIHAELVFDGVNKPIVPTNMGMPTGEQMIGTPYEIVGETALRICYASNGYDEMGKPKGRSSAKSHAHIIETKNFSVYEHINFTVGIYEKVPAYEIYRCLLNRKGVHIEVPDDGSVQITFNPRVLFDWQRHTTPTNNTRLSNTLFLTLYNHASKLIPQILRPTENLIGGLNCTTIERLNANQQWITMYLADSRSWSHEQVRHRNPAEESLQLENPFWAVSQRSTRYVDESEAAYVPNPDIEEFLADKTIDEGIREEIQAVIIVTEQVTKQAYRKLNGELTKYYINKGMEGTPARKKARGAARDYLCNALATEMIYSAPISGWQWIIENRNNSLADSRMKRMYSQVKQILQNSIHGEHFY